MNFLRKHWFDLGGFLSVVVLISVFILYKTLTHYQLLMWLSLTSLFLHQLEEYRVAGTFPGMMNTVMYHSSKPDRYPLNTNTALLINTVIGWTLYFLSAVFAEKAIWLGLASMVVSTGNIIVHTIVFNIKGHSFYNAGMFTSLFLFLPCVYFFFSVVRTEMAITITDYVIGILLGIAINVVGIVKMINWMANEHTPYIFEERNVFSKDRRRT